MISVADDLAQRGIPSYCFSMEMGADQLGRRFLCRRAQIDHTRLLTGQLTREDWQAVQQVLDSTAEYPVFIDDRTRDTQQLLDIAGEWIFEHGKGPIFIDYLQLAKKRKGESTYDAVSRAGYEYKWMSKLLDVPVVALTQLNRTADDATAESQTYDSWLRASGELEQAADVILFLLGEKTPNEVAERVMVVHKERHRGGGHRIDVEFNQPKMTFASSGTWLAPRAEAAAAQSLALPQLIQPARRSLMSDKNSWMEKLAQEAGA
jgi:replicative DNA helicase